MVYAIVTDLESRWRLPGSRREPFREADQRHDFLTDLGVA